ncbi:MAG: hypothetical protein GC190_20170 [Alphaproteobacteria bacterium]|nr:hypothetical protein [Alphaproteobacteria bacterium]
MFAAAILQAWGDLFGVPVCLEGGERLVAREEARRFLTDESGPWKESRDTICGAIGEDGDTLRANALRQLTLTAPPLLVVQTKPKKTPRRARRRPAPKTLLAAE